jgi:hypothetical protein
MANDTAVPVKIDFASIIENILQLLPEINNIVVVIGSSPIEKYWLEQMRDAFSPYTDRVKFTWFAELVTEPAAHPSGKIPRLSGDIEQIN